MPCSSPFSDGVLADICFHSTVGYISLIVRYMKRISEDRAIALSDLKTELQHLNGPVYLVGDGAALAHKNLSAELENLILPPEHRRHQRASGVALAALAAMDRGESDDGAALQPNYLRLSQAERERMEKLQANK